MDTQPTPATGALYSGADYRDGYALMGAVALATGNGSVSLPESLHNNTGGVLMQSQEPACVSFSLVKLLKIYFFHTTGQWINFSPRFLDTLMKRYDGQDRATGGAIPRLGLKLLTTVGCATELTVPNDTNLPVLSYRNDAILTQAAFAEASKYKLPGFVQVPKDLVATRQGIYLYGSVSTLLQIGDEFWTPSWQDAAIDPLRTPKSIVSGHEMTQVGYPSLSSPCNIIENQWSEKWANEGSALMEYDKWMPFIMEQWAPAIIPTDVKDFLATLPSPSSFHHTWTVAMAQGEQSENVKYLQIALMILGYLAPVDPSSLGIYGPRTTVALSKYLADNGVHADGRNAGPTTIKLLNKQFSL